MHFAKNQYSQAGAAVRFVDTVSKLPAVWIKGQRVNKVSRHKRSHQRSNGLWENCILGMLQIFFT